MLKKVNFQTKGDKQKDLLLYAINHAGLEQVYFDEAYFDRILKCKERKQ
jgi:hypothetical protein